MFLNPKCTVGLKFIFWKFWRQVGLPFLGSHKGDKGADTNVSVLLALYLTGTSNRLGIILRPPKERVKIKDLDYIKFTDENMYNAFSIVSWDHILIEPDKNDMMEQFNMQYGSLLEQLIVRQTRFVKSRVLPLWHDAEVKKEMKVYDELKLQKDWCGYQIERKLVTSMICRKEKLP